MRLALFSSVALGRIETVQYRIEFNMRVEIPLILMNAYFLRQNYLERYGYLSPADVEIGKTTLNSGKVSDAVRKLQHFAGLNETGNLLDPSTVELVTKQRCGFRDLGNTAQFKRRRRYALHGTWWRKHVSYRARSVGSNHAILRVG